MPLTHLDLSFNPHLTGTGFGCLTGMPISELYLENSGLGDAGLAFLINLPLADISFKWCSNVSCDAIEALRQALEVRFISSLHPFMYGWDRCYLGSFYIRFSCMFATPYMKLSPPMTIPFLNFCLGISKVPFWGDKMTRKDAILLFVKKYCSARKICKLFSPGST